MFRLSAIALTTLLFVAHPLTANAQRRTQRLEEANEQTITGTLGHGRIQQQRFVEVRSIRLQAGEQIAIDVASTDFDTMVRVEGNGLREEDDDSGGGTNSFVHFQAPATGLYRVIVTSYEPRETGEYQLTISRGAAAVNRIRSVEQESDTPDNDGDEGTEDQLDQPGFSDSNGGNVPGNTVNPPLPVQQTLPSQLPPAPAGFRYTYDSGIGQWYLVPGVAPNTVPVRTNSQLQLTPQSVQPAQATIVLYGASWCPACHQAASFLRSNNIPFVQHDIEREPQVARDLRQRAQQQGVATNSIPIVEVNGRLMSGFDPSVVRRAVGR